MAAAVSVGGRPKPASSPKHEAEPSLELIDSGAFGRRLVDEIARAQHRVLIQVMTFDGDSAGLGVAEALIDASQRHVAIELLVDSYATKFLSDTPAKRSAVRSEAAATEEMFDRLRTAGVAVSFTNPWGAGLFAATRNHKKIFVVDEVAFLGGINISDHNYLWRDFNVSVSDPSVVAALAEDFAHTRSGGRRSVDGPVVTNRFVQSTFESLVAEAQDRVIVASPYALDLSLVRALERSPASTRVLISPMTNNFAAIRATDPYLRDRLASAGVELWTYPDFFHSKFVLVDDGGDGPADRAVPQLLIGSSNFGRHSFRCNEEVGLVINDPTFIAEFRDVALGDTETMAIASSRLTRATGRVAAHAINTGIGLLGSLIAPRVPTLAKG